MSERNIATDAGPKPVSNPLSLDPEYPADQAPLIRDYHLDSDDRMRFRGIPDPTQRTQDRVDILEQGVENFQLGQEGAILQLEKDIDFLQYNNSLDPILQKMQDDGKLSVERDANGDITHLIFNGLDGKERVDVDLKTGDVNGESKEQLRDDAAKQAEEFMHDKLMDDRFDDPSTDEKALPITDKARQATSDLINAVIEHDQAALEKLAKEILNDPAMMAECKAALEKMQSAPISIDGDPSNPKISIVSNDAHGSKIVFDKTGSMNVESKYTVPLESPANTLLRGSNFALKWADRYLAGTERVLKDNGSLPADGYINMPSLVDAYYDSGWNQYF